MIRTLLLLGAAAASPSTPDPTLQALLDRIGARLASPGYSQFVQTETEEDLDDKGRTTATRMCRSAMAFQPDGGLHGKVLEAVEYGEEVTEKIRRFREKRSRKARAEGKPENGLDLDVEQRLPLERSQQPRYLFTSEVLDPTHVRLRFVPRTPDPRAWIGEATVETNSGTLRRIHGRPSNTPRFVDRIEMTMEFADEVPGGTVPSRTVIEGAAHFLFFNKRMRYTAVSVDFRP